MVSEVRREVGDELGGGVSLGLGDGRNVQANKAEWLRCYANVVSVHASCTPCPKIINLVITYTCASSLASLYLIKFNWFIYIFEIKLKTRLVLGSCI
jgi:hypothetical protein